MLESTLLTSMLNLSATTGSKERQVNPKMKTVPRRKKSEQSKKRKSTTKKVAFVPIVQCRPIPSLSALEISFAWYTRAEFKAALTREDFIRWSVSKNHDLFLLNKENLNAQGIATKRGALKKQEAIASSVKAVLEEQDEQETIFFDVKHKRMFSTKRGSKRDDLFSLNAEKIAKAYRCHSKTSLKEAQSRALRHEKHLRKLVGHPSIPETSPSLSPGRQLKKANSFRLLPKKLTINKKDESSNSLPRPLLSAVDAAPQTQRCTNPAA